MFRPRTLAETGAMHERHVLLANHFGDKNVVAFDMLTPLNRDPPGLGDAVKITLRYRPADDTISRKPSLERGSAFSVSCIFAI